MHVAGRPCARQLVYMVSAAWCQPPGSHVAILLLHQTIVPCMHLTPFLHALHFFPRRLANMGWVLAKFAGCRHTAMCDDQQKQSPEQSS